MLTKGDKYLLEKEYDYILGVDGEPVLEEGNPVVDEDLKEYTKNPPFQELKYFTISDDKEQHDVDSTKIYIHEDGSNVDETLNNVA